MKLSDDFNGADLRNVCTEAGQYNAGHADARLNMDVTIPVHEV